MDRTAGAGHYSHYTDTRPYGSHYGSSSSGPGCNNISGGGGMGTGSPDVAYSFTPSETATYRIRMDLDAFDGLLYVVTDCDAIATNGCVCTTYFIIADGWTSTNTSYGGRYTLTVSKL